MSYQHGVSILEQPTSITPPVRTDVSLPVVLGAAPVHNLPAEAEKPINSPRLLFSYPEAVSSFGAPAENEDGNTFSLHQMAEIYLRRYSLAPVVFINVFDPEKHKDAEGKPDVSKVTTADIMGGIDSITNQRTGLELVDEIFPRFGLVPGQILAPGFSGDESVAIMLGAKAAKVSGNFTCTSGMDIPSSVKSYTEASDFLKDNNLADPYNVAFFGQPFFNNKPEWGSIHQAAVTALRDSQNEFVPYHSPSNTRMLASGLVHAGKELYLDSSQAAYLNGQGIVTGLNFDGSLVSWGNRTTAYPGTTDPKDTFIPIRRMFNWVANQLVLTARPHVDRPLTRQQIENVCDTFNIWLNGLTSRNFILGGRVEFLADENPATDLMDGIYRFHLWLTPPSPGRLISFILEYSPSYLNVLYGTVE